MARGYTGAPEKPSPEDAWIVCVDCRTRFLLTIGERRFYESKNFVLPFRCRPCRLARRAAREREQST